MPGPRRGPDDELPPPRRARTAQAQHVAGPAASSGTGRRVALRPVHRDGALWCIVGADHPNDPARPRSPYCAEHRTLARNATFKRSRESAQQAAAIMDVVVDPRGHRFENGAYVGPRGIAVMPERAAQARASFGEFLSALDTARNRTNNLQPGRGAEYYLDELVHLAQAASNLNEALGPLLYEGPTPRR